MVTILKNKYHRIYVPLLLAGAILVGAFAGFEPVLVLFAIATVALFLFSMYSLQTLLALLLFIRPVLDVFRDVYIPGPLEGILNPAGVISMLFVALGFIWLVVNSREKLRSSPLTLPGIIFLILAFVAAIIPPNKTAALAEWLRYLSYFFMYFLMINTIKTTVWLHRMLIAVILSVIIPLVVGLWQIVDRDFVVMIFGFNQIQSVFAHPNMFGAYLAMLGPIILLMALTDHSANLRLIYFLIFGAVVFCLLRTYARVGWVGFLIGVSIILFKDHRKLLILIPVSAALFWALDPGVRDKWLLIFGTTTRENSLISRFMIWRDALNLFLRSPIIGSGLRSFTGLIEVVQGGYAHNIYIQLLVEMGVLGLLSYLLIQWNMLSIAIRVFRENANWKLKPITLGFLSVFISLSAMALVDNILSVTVLQWYLWAFAGMASCAIKMIDRM